MNLNLLLSFTGICTFLLVTNKVFSQNAADLSITGAPDSAVYSGYPSAGIYAVSVTNTSGFTVPNSSAIHSFVVTLSIPTGCEFPLTLANVPVGWEYERTSVTDALFKPVAGFGTGTAVFFVPFAIQNSFNQQPYVGQIQQLLPTYTDSVINNNSNGGVISVNNVPLPVIFGQINALATNSCTVELTWSTLNEKNNKYFEIQRSNDSKLFSTIGKISAIGNSTIATEYNFIDEKPLIGKAYYRIVQFDFDHKSSKTQTVWVEQNCIGQGISIFPNPAVETATIKGLSGLNTVKIFATNGQLVSSAYSDAPQHSLNLTHLTPGNYQVQVIKDGTIIFNGKLTRKDN